mmetsp:Transcript_63584/g.174591  ORF Transcript_63584/g.174591 Transcript_63584/m.174591 type:complete len:147 (+) Transcript_63584:752-1192(+)|eukprot:3133714-Prymnesium_polylepis.2
MLHTLFAILSPGTLLSASYDGSVRAWRSDESGASPWKLEAEVQLAPGESTVGAAGRVLSLAAWNDGDGADDGGALLCGTGAGTLHLVRPQTLEEVESLVLPDEALGRIGALAAMPLPRATSGADAGLRVAIAGTSTGELHSAGMGL